MARRLRGRAAALAVVVAAVAFGGAEALAGGASLGATAGGRGLAEAAGGGRGRRALLGERNHSYKKGEEVKLYANKVGPFHNPSETYQYYSLPFCTPEEGKKYRPEDLGEVLEGDRLVNSPYELKFAEDVAHEELCTKKYTSRELSALRAAVENDYYFQMFLDDDLPVWGFIGKVERVPPKRSAAALAAEEAGAGAGGGAREEPRGKPHGAAAFAEGEQRRLYLFTHFHFDIGYNGDRVIELNVSTAAADPSKTVDVTAPAQPEGGGIALEPPREVTFSYSARWRPVETRFEDRMDRFSRYSFLPQHLEIHWFSIVNSCVTVLLLTGFLATILLRVLRADLVRYARGGSGGAGGAANDGGESGGGGLNGNGASSAAADDDETGWKHLHGDVFRFPPNPSLFAALVGAGSQLLLVAVCVFALALLGTFYPYNRGAMMTAAIVLYALTAGVAGYVSACWYRMLGGRRWAGNVVLTAGLFCGPLFLVFSFANSVAWAGGSTQALPFGTIVAILAVWALVTLPLTVLGGAAGKQARGEYDAPCRTAKFPREIPPSPWYRTLPAQMAMAGFLPFSAIYIELYYVFATVWGHKVYVVYPILAIVYGLVIVVTAFVTVALTYFQLASEDHRWWWRSFLCGGSTGLFVAGYCVFYWLFRSDMRGLLQGTFYFGYNAVACYGLFLMLGSVGFRASNAFVRRIYHEVKLD